MRHIKLLMFLWCSFTANKVKAEFGLAASGQVAEQTTGLQLNMAGFHGTAYWGPISWFDLLVSYGNDQYKIQYLDRTDRCSEQFISGGVGFKTSYVFADLLVGPVKKDLAVKTETDQRAAINLGVRIPMSKNWNALAALATSKDRMSQEAIHGASLGVQFFAP